MINRAHIRSLQKKFSLVASISQKFNRIKVGSFLRVSMIFQPFSTTLLLMVHLNIFMTQSQKDGYQTRIGTSWNRILVGRYKENSILFLIFEYLMIQKSIEYQLPYDSSSLSIPRKEKPLIILIYSQWQDYNQMQNSRLSKYGKQSLKNRTNFTLLQEINKHQFDNDSPIKNASTVYLDENGKEKQLSEYNSPLTKSKSNDIYLQNQSSISKTDFYALPKKSAASEYPKMGGSEKERKFNNPVRSAKSEMLRLKQKKDQELLQKKEEENKRLLNVKKPVNFQRKRNNFQEIDFIGGNLYEIEDIITDINRIIDHTKKSNVVGNSKDQKGPPLKQNKWLNDHFGGLSKLDQLLNSYKSTSQEQKSAPIIEEFYRQSTYQKKNIEENIKKNKNSFNFPTKNLRKSEHKLSLALIKWNQMPMIASKWNPQIYLKLQSFPQQEQYRKVVFKAYELRIKSYSIFFQPQAGISKGNMKNDKKINGKMLMSQQQYAKVWQQRFPSPSEFTEEQKQILMEFDIEWYRAIIQLCYNSGLQDLLQKQYDLQTYLSVMNSIQRQKEVTTQLIVKNQIRYLQQYFDLIYPYLSNQTVLGMIRIENESKTSLKDVQRGFAQIFRKIQEQSIESQVKIEEFSIWSFDLNNQSLIMILKLCGSKQANNVIFQKDQTILVKLEKPKLWFTLIQQRDHVKKEKTKKENQAQEQKYIEERPDEEDDGQYQQAVQEYPNKAKIPQSSDPSEGSGYRLILRASDENDWEVLIKIQQERFKKEEEEKIKLLLSEQLLFGSLFYIDTDRI